MGTYLFIVLHAPSWSLLPCGDSFSPLVLVSLQISVHARGSESMHGETRSHATRSECSSSRKTSFNDHHLLSIRTQLYEALIIHKIHWIMIISKSHILGLLHQFVHFGKTFIIQILRISSSKTWSYISNGWEFYKSARE